MNHLTEWDHAPSRLALAGESGAEPRVTIAITTYQRPDLLIEAIESAIAQRDPPPYEILVVDNDPASSPEQLIRRLPQLRQLNFRYYVNDENLGMFGNFNRAIQLARGEWLTILNDDDLLEPDCLKLLMAELLRTGADGIVPHKTFFDQREKKNPPASLLRRTAKRLLIEQAFLGAVSRRIRPRKLFWGAMLGNGAGFLFRRTGAIDLGGFDPDEFPSSDYWLYKRFAERFHLRQHRAVLAKVRKAENETARPSSVKAGLQQGFRLQQSLLGSSVPRWYRHLLPMIAARHRAEFHDFWGTDVPKQEVEKALRIRLAKDRPLLLWSLRFLLRGF